MKIVFGIENQFDIRHSGLKIEIGNHKKPGGAGYVRRVYLSGFPISIGVSIFYT